LLLDDIKSTLNELLVGMAVYPGTSTAALDLYCDPAGNDSNPGTALLPVRQPAAALALVPRHLRHRATIHLAPGSYQGFSVTGFVFDPQPDGTQIGLAVAGTFVTATPVTGTATGTSTGAANGSVTTPSWAVLTDSGQSWTPEDLRGRFLEITTGTGAGQILPIVHNDATHIYVMTTTWSAAPSGSGYAIHDQGAIINTPIQVPSPLAAIGATPIPATNAGIVVAGNLGLPRAPYLRFENLKVDLSGLGLTHAYCADVQVTPATTFQCCSFTTDVGPCVQADGPGYFRVLQSVFRTQGDNAGVVMGGIGPMSGASGGISGCVFDSHASGSTMATIGGGNDVTILNCESNATTGVLMVGPCFLTLDRVRFVGDGNSAQQIKARAQNNSPGFCAIQVPAGTGIDISGVARSNAVELEGPHCALFDGLLNGSGNGTALWLSAGARVRLSAGSTITGTSEIVLDGAAPQTIAAMRAASPPHLSNDLLTIIHE
jgi:hypothetical protein